MCCLCHQKKDTTSKVSTQYSFSEGKIPGVELAERFFPTNSPSRSATKEDSLRVCKSAEWTRKGNFFFRRGQQFHSSKKWSQDVLPYLRTNRPCFLQRTGKEPRHAEQTGSGFECIHNLLQQKFWKAMFMCALLLENRMHAFLHWNSL